MNYIWPGQEMHAVVFSFFLQQVFMVRQELTEQRWMHNYYNILVSTSLLTQIFLSVDVLSLHVSDSSVAAS